MVAMSAAVHPPIEQPDEFARLVIEFLEAS